jgi:NADP-dependent 3-hydroxy acid dehydrogenase YdfG
MRLENKVAIITGAGQGIGAATARRFAQEGASVVLAARRLNLLQEVVEEIEAAGGTAMALSVDISDEQAVKELVSDTVKAPITIPRDGARTSRSHLTGRCS